MLKLVPLLLAAVLASSCGTAGNFTRGMEEPVAVLKKAAAIAEDADNDILRSYAIGLLEDGFVGSPDAEVICKPWAGPATAKKDLGVFTDSVETAKKVGEAPSDTTYSGYVRKFRENAAAAKPKNYEAEQAEAAKKAAAALTQCKKLFAADTAGGVTLKSVPAGPQSATPALIGRILGLDALIKGALAQAEAAQRAVAVRKTVEYLIPQMEKAQTELALDAGTSFGPMVIYPAGTNADVLAMNRTVLGATVTLRRWHVARHIQEQWKYLEECRNKKGAGCMGDPLKRMAAESFATNVKAYRGLSAVEPAKVATSLQAAITAARDSLKTDGITGVIDALVSFGDAVESLGEAYGKYDKSKD